MDINIPETKKIVIITTGGTIGQKKNNDGIKEPVRGVIEHVTDVAIQSIGAETGLNLERQSISFEIRNLMLIDSGNTTPKTQLEVARAIFNASIEDGVMSILVTTGTAKLNETINTMPLMVETHMPVIFVGSEKSHDEKSTDAYRNMKKAIIAAYELSNIGISGIYLSFNRRLIPATRVVEMDSSFYDIREFKGQIFGSFNKDILTLNGEERDLKIDETLRISCSTLYSAMAENVPLIPIISGVDRKSTSFILERAAEEFPALVLQTNHDMSAREDLHPTLERIAKKIPVFVTSFYPTFPYAEGIGSYQTSRKLYSMGIYPGTGQPFLDIAIARAAIGGSENPREAFMDGVLRSHLENFHRNVLPTDLERRRGMEYIHALTMARDMNHRRAEEYSKLALLGTVRRETPANRIKIHS